MSNLKLRPIIGAIALVCLGTKLLSAQPVLTNQSAVGFPAVRSSPVAPSAKPAKSKPTSAKQAEPAGCIDLAKGKGDTKLLPQNWAECLTTIAALRMTAFVEGTWYPGMTKRDPYRTQALSYRQVASFKDHPYWLDGVIPCAQTLAGWICSACTGSSQWHPDTYDSIRKMYQKDFWYINEYFSPENQDLATIYHYHYNKSLTLLWNGIYRDTDGTYKVKQKNFREFVYRNSHTWASFPKHAGDEYGAHGQGAAAIQKMQKFFERDLADLQKGKR